MLHLRAREHQEMDGVLQLSAQRSMNKPPQVLRFSGGYRGESFG